MEQKINLSDGEWKIMQKLWKRPPRTIMELVTDLREATGWSKHTVISMLSRMEAKGAVHYEDGSRAKKYFPSVAYEDIAVRETESFLSKVYSGSIGMMMNALVDNKALSKSDIDELYAILKKAEGEGVKDD